MNCNNAINGGMMIRLISTYLILKENGEKNLLFLPLILTGLDVLDNVLMTDKSCTKTYNYQIKDKLVDVISYILLLFFYEFDEYIKYFIYYRLVGVLLYITTQNSAWLIIFFDFVKEYMIYRYVFGDNNRYLGISIIGKIIFEIYLHKYKNGIIR